MHTEIRPDYDFDAWLNRRSRDWFDDDAYLRELLDHYAPGTDRDRLHRLGPRAAQELQRLAERSARPENAPELRYRDAHDHQVDEVVLPASTEEALRIAHGELGLGAVRGSPFVHYALIYLLAQNGEAGVACSLACTDGLVRALRAHFDGAGAGTPDDPRQAALDAVMGSSANGYAHGAQFVTEIQGGSDVPANETRAEPDGADAAMDGGYRLRGQKWFCSNINADWFLVTARPESGPGEGNVAVFLVPAYLEGRRNGYTIDRLKDKLGTRELATAEVTFDGAHGWLVGPADRGVGFLLRQVLTPSRFGCVLFAAGALRRAERLVTSYAEFREAFGRAIADYPLVRRTLDRTSRSRQQALTVSFELLRLWEAAEAGGYQGDEARDFRILLSLAKPVLTQMATDGIHEAMMIVGGNGIEERFSPLPRLYRDSVIMETWEGPHNVLFTQALRDLARFEMQPEPFLERVTGTAQPELAQALVGAMAAARDGRAAMDGTVRMADLAPALMEALAEGVRPG